MRTANIAAVVQVTIGMIQIVTWVAVRATASAVRLLVVLLALAATHADTRKRSFAPSYRVHHCEVPTKAA